MTQTSAYVYAGDGIHSLTGCGHSSSGCSRWDASENTQQARRRPGTLVQTKACSKGFPGTSISGCMLAVKQEDVVNFCRFRAGFSWFPSILEDLDTLRREAAQTLLQAAEDGSLEAVLKKSDKERIWEEKGMKGWKDERMKGCWWYLMFSCTFSVFLFFSPRCTDVLEKRHWYHW